MSDFDASELDPSELYQVVGQHLLDAAPADWVEAGAIYRSVGKFSECKFFAILKDGKKKALDVEDDVFFALDQLHDLFAQPGTGAWFTATGRLDREGRISFDFDYDNEPQRNHPRGWQNASRRHVSGRRRRSSLVSCQARTAGSP